MAQHSVDGEQGHLLVLEAGEGGWGQIEQLQGALLQGLAQDAWPAAQQLAGPGDHHGQQGVGGGCIP